MRNKLRVAPALNPNEKDEMLGYRSYWNPVNKLINKTRNDFYNKDFNKTNGNVNNG